LYSSGGKMYMLLPNRQEVKEAIKSIEDEMVEYIFQEHKTRLYLCMSYITFGYNEENNKFVYEGKEEDISELWKSLGEKAQKKKSRKFSNILSGNKTNTDLNFNDFFKPQSEGFDTSDDTKGSWKQCLVTGEIITHKTREKNDLVYHKSEPNESAVWVDEDVKRQVDIGGQLKDAIYFNTFKLSKHITEDHKYYLSEPLKMGVYHALKDEHNFVDEFLKINRLPSLDDALLRKINHTNFLPEKDGVVNGEDSSYGFVFYGGNKQAENPDGTEKNYHELAGISDEGENEKGFNKLGVLRLDIDGLGGIFATGMKDIQSFATHTTLSSRLDLFFAGYLNTIREKFPNDGGDKFKDWVNILYSGGDDVFAVGRWDLILKFAAQIRDDFRGFTGRREDVSLSAGIALVGGKFPIVKAAEMSGKAEKKAKNFERDNTQNYLTTRKNALTILNVTISWEDEFDFVRKLSDELLDMLKEKQLSKSVFA